MKRSRSRLSVVVALLMALGLLAAACSSDDNSSGTTDTTSAGNSNENVPVDAPGVTDTEINYTILSTATNSPTGSCDLPCFATGIQAYFDYVNTEQGGIYGRKLVADKLVDDEFTKNQEKALEVISDNDAFGVFTESAIPAGFQALADEGIPTYVWATNPVAMQGNESIWGENTVRCLDVGCWDRVVPYIMKVSGRHKLASVGYGIADSSKQCAQNVAKSVEQSADQIGEGAESVYMNDNLAYGTPNGAAAEVTAMKEAGADILATCIVNSDTKTIMTEAERQGLDIIPAFPQGYDDEQMAAIGNSFDGGYLRNSIRSFQASPLNEAQEKYLEYTKKNGGQVDEVTIYGWINAALAVEGLKQAGPDFSR